MSPHRKGPKPCRDTVMHEQDHDLLSTGILEEAREHARKLCNLIPYSMLQVKPAVSATFIFRLIGLVTELQTNETAAALRVRNGLLQRDIEACHRVMDQWQIQYPAPKAPGVRVTGGAGASGAGKSKTGKRGRPRKTREGQNTVLPFTMEAGA